MQQSQIIEIGIVWYPGALKSPIYGFIDLFQLANSVCLKSTPLQQVQFNISQWREHETDGEMVNCDENQAQTINPLDVLIVPPSVNDAGPAVSSNVLTSWLADFAASGTLMCSVCAGAFVLADSKLLQNRPATTHWNLADVFRARFPDVALDVDHILVDAGNIITASGIMSWIDMGLHLVERFTSPSISIELGKLLIVDTGYRQQIPYKGFSRAASHGDARILEAQKYIDVHISETLRVGNIATQVRMSQRTFLRHFTKATGLTPTEYIQQVRIETARELIELKPLSIEQIAWQVGYQDYPAFQNRFKKILGLSPARYRARFSRTAV